MALTDIIGVASDAAYSTREARSRRKRVQDISWETARTRAVRASHRTNLNQSILDLNRYALTLIIATAWFTAEVQRFYDPSTWIETRVYVFGKKERPQIVLDDRCAPDNLIGEVIQLD